MGGRAQRGLHHLVPQRAKAVDPQHHHPPAELFYWATVFATFALGTAFGDFTATALGLGYLARASSLVVILIPAVAWRFFRMNEVLAFWFAYVVTRPLGASVADYLSKPTYLSGPATATA